MPELSVAQRILAYSVMVELSRSPSCPTSPFAQHILDSLDIATNILESQFALQLLTNSSCYEEIKAKTPEQVLASLQLVHQLDLDRDRTASSIAAGLKGVRFESKLTVTSSNALHAMGVSPMVRAREQTTHNNSNTGPGIQTWSNERIYSEHQQYESLLSDASIKELRPSFVHLPPPLMDIQEDELLWDETFTDDAACLLWNPDLAESIAQSAAEQETRIAELLQSAHRAPYSPKQQQELVAYVDAHPAFLADCGLEPYMIPGLVENNWNLAVECLLRLKDSDLISPDGRSPGKQAASSSCQHSTAPATGVSTVFLQPLLSAELTFRSIEVVNALCGRAALPTQFVHPYVAHCIACCEKIADKALQVSLISRYVRLVCVLLQSLLSKNASSIAGVLVEIQTFCLTYPHVKEASLLYRAIKQKDGVIS